MHGAGEIVSSCSELGGIAYEYFRIGGRESKVRWGVCSS